MASEIHPSAVIAPGAELADGCRIGPFCVIGPQVSLGAGCVLHSHVVLDGHTSLGPECEVFPFASLGGKTQDLKYRGETTYLRIGARTAIREYVTIHSATGGGLATEVGDDCLIQAYCHVAHDCRLGNRVIMSSGAMMAGHVVVDDDAILAGMAGVVQFVHIGRLAFVGAYSKLVQDAMPYCITDGAPAECKTINKVGLERHGFAKPTIHALHQAYKTLFRSGRTLEEAAAELAEKYREIPEVQQMVDFARTSERGIPRPRQD